MSYRDKETLRNLYVDKQLTYDEIAEKFDVHRSTIGKWINKFGITRKYQDPEMLKNLYWDKKLSTAEIGDKLGCDATTVRRQLHKHNIKVRKASHERPVHLSTDNKGYETWRTNVNGKLHAISVHRLLAISEFGIEAVKNRSVHHKNRIPWDNRSDNIEVMSQSNHINSEHKDESGRFISIPE